MNPHTDWRLRVEKILFFAALLYGGILLAPIFCQPVFATLDSSWGFALNYFIHTGLKFGPDLIATYGPLGFLSTPVHVGNNIAIALAVRTLLWGFCLFQLAALRIAGNRTGAWVLLIALAVAQPLYHYQWEHLVFSVIVILYIRLITEPHDKWKLVFIAALTGLLFLLKFSSFVAAVLALVIYMAHFALTRAKTRSRTASRVDYLFLSLPWIAGPVLYLCYQPSFAALIDYVHGMMELASGYVVTMTLDTDPRYAATAAVVCVLLIIVSLSAAIAIRPVPWVGITFTLVFTWAAFRQGFSRSDSRHNAAFFFVAPFILAVLIALAKTTPARRRALVASFVLMLAVSLPAADETWGNKMETIGKPELDLFSGFSIFQWQPAMQFLDNVFQDSVSKAPIQFYRARLAHQRVLIYPWDLAYAAQSNFDLFPLYSLQAYESYTHYLDLMSARKLSEANPPVRYVVLEFKAIDERNPVVDNPAFWSAMLSQYSPVQIDAASALLERRPSQLPLVYQPLANEPYRFGEWVSVPRGEAPVATAIRFKPSLRTTFTAMLYRLEPIFMEAKTRGGKVRRIRVTPDIMASPFIVDSLPSSFEDAMDLWRAKPLADPVEQIRLTGDSLTGFSAPGWEFSTVRGLSPAPPIQPAPPPAAPIPADLNGFLESVNGVPGAAHPLPLGKSVTLKGWLAIGDPATDGKAPDEIFAMAGSTKVEAQISDRPDVRDHFKNPRLLASGYRIEIPAQLIATPLMQIEIVGMSREDGKKHRFPQALSVSY